MATGGYIHFLVLYKDYDAARNKLLKYKDNTALPQSKIIELHKQIEEIRLWAPNDLALIEKLTKTLKYTEEFLSNPSEQNKEVYLKRVDEQYKYSSIPTYLLAGLFSIITGITATMAILVSSITVGALIGVFGVAPAGFMAYTFFSHAKEKANFYNTLQGLSPVV